MKRQDGLVRKYVLGVLLSSVAWAVPGMQAQAGDLPVKAPAAEPVPYWWFHGEVEAGGRFFLNNPQRNGSAYLNQNSLAKYYEYSSIKPGPFSNIWLSTGSSDGLYRIDVGGLNIGYSDQRYYLDASKAGQHYFNFQWDQTPHVYSTSAQTPFQGVGTNNLTVTPINFTGGASPPLHQTDIGIRRDTASGNYRWTPTDAWDINADYSHMSRTGTQVDGVIFLSGASNGVEVPKPVDDATQNYGLNGEYAGTSPWGQKVTAKVGYTGSQYTDNFSSYTIQNPGSNGTPLNARLVLPPSNNANGFSGTLAADLPLKSRYVGTVSYTMMRQDDAFLPFSLNQVVPTALPASSLNGAINTTLSNNIITTKITPELTSKLSYRYYDFDNQTPQFFFPVWPNRDNTTTSAAEPIQTLSISYTKQNAGAQLNWRPSHAWNLTGEYGYERYNYTQADANVTNEHSGKLSADWKPMNWLTTRASVSYADRRYDTYDYTNFVRNIQFPGGLVNEWYYANSYRQFMFANRQQTKANFAVDFVAFRGVTITPTFKFKDDDYGIDANRQQGLNDSRSLAAGVDVAFIVNPDLSFAFGYMREHFDQSLYGYTPTGGGGAGATMTTTSSKSNVDTFTAAMNYIAIPDKLTLDARYVLSLGVDDTKLNLCCAALSTTGPAFPVQFPNDTTWFQRLDATATYRFDRQTVAQMGWKGDVKTKLHYTWARNSVSNWQNDPVAPYITTLSPRELFMAWDNPNYNVHMLAVSLVASW